MSQLSVRTVTWHDDKAGGEGLERPARVRLVSESYSGLEHRGYTACSHMGIYAQEGHVWADVLLLKITNTETHKSCCWPCMAKMCRHHSGLFSDQTDDVEMAGGLLLLLFWGLFVCNCSP